MVWWTFSSDWLLWWFLWPQSWQHSLCPWSCQTLGLKNKPPTNQNCLNTHSTPRFWSVKEFYCEIVDTEEEMNLSFNPCQGSPDMARDMLDLSSAKWMEQTHAHGDCFSRLNTKQLNYISYTWINCHFHFCIRSKLLEIRISKTKNPKASEHGHLWDIFQHIHHFKWMAVVSLMFDNRPILTSSPRTYLHSWLYGR